MAANWKYGRSEPPPGGSFARVMQRGDGASPRPSSTNSSQSFHSFASSEDYQDHGPRPGQDICIGEEVKIAIHLAMERFRMNESQKELEFPSSLTATERAYVHKLCEGNGLKSRSKGKGSGRFLTVTKKEGCLSSQSSASFYLARNSRQQILNLLQRYPVSNKERQELIPRVDRNQPNDVGKELNKTTIGKLNNGVAQVPPPRSDSDLNAFREGLPVFKHRQNILDTLNNNRVILISGETGSGKTTQVPQMILDDCCNKKLPCRIFCTQPRRIAALSIAERVALERGEKIGQTVGYQIRLESKVSPKTLLTFCTNGVLLRTLMNGDASFGGVTHIIVDEVHERDRFSDFLLASMDDLMTKHSHLKVILMSAALNTQLFVQFFNNCPVVHIPGTLFTVKEYYLEDILKWTNYSNKAMEKAQREKTKVTRQQEQLEEWCAKMSIGSSEKEEESDTGKASQANTETTQKNANEDKEELQDWIVKEMDQYLTDIFLIGSEDKFTQMVHLIMSENVSVDYQHSETGVTPLMVTTARGLSEEVEQLLNLGANVNLHTPNGWTAIDWAKRFQRVDILEMLEALMLSNDVGPSGDSVIEADNRLLTDAEKDLLSLYQNCFDDEKVDIQLILNLIYQLMINYSEGAILVFLPGYDDIVGLRDLIADDTFFHKYKYLVFTLHSAMQSNDQRRVFKTPPPGVRKIILATNIAETSITIDDVVFVIDSGKVKEKTFDALLSVTMLKSNWISKASALQRKGRSGRLRPGHCYHLFSKVRYSNLMDFPAPEILRYPLQELCLHTKLLAPKTCSIADFLSKCPEPPTFLLTRNAIHLLKQIDALDSCEDLTELGHHLSDLPVEPCLGKMVLYSVVLKCLDPVLTIVCTLAYKDPFVLPNQPNLKREASMSRRKFAADTFSDHMALLRAFQAWQRARTDGWEKSFCDKNYLSSACMEMIVGMRTQLLGQLRASGFVRARGGGDIRDLNTNSENWAVVKAALCAGSYPNLLRVDRQKAKLTTQKESNVFFHMSSVVSQIPSSKKTQKSQFIKSLRSDWLFYQEMTRFQRHPMVRTCTMVSPITVAVFAGPAKLSPDSVKDRHLNRNLGIRGEFGSEESDSEGEGKEDDRKTTLQLDEWLGFKLDNETMSIVLQLRQKWNSLLLRRMKSPSKTWSQLDESVVRTIVNVLTNEEQTMGLQQPAGIGQRPRPMTAESIMSGGSGKGNFDFVTPPRKNFQFQQRASTSGVETTSSSSSNSPSTNTSLRGSQSSTPSMSPGPASPGGNHGLSVSFFVMKCNSQKQLDMSMNKGVWTTNASNNKKLNSLFQEGKAVYLIFSIHGSGHFQGYAKMKSEFVYKKAQDSSHHGSDYCCDIEWIKRANLPFQSTHQLLNPWDDNRKVQSSKDGQEIAPHVGEALVKLWDKYSGPQGKSSPLVGNKPQYAGKRGGFHSTASPEGHGSYQSAGNDPGEYSTHSHRNFYNRGYQDHSNYGGYHVNEGSHKGQRGQGQRGKSPMNQGLHFDNYSGYHTGGYQDNGAPPRTDYGPFNYHQRGQGSGGHQHGGHRRGNHNRSGNKR
ncbi:LOW QUALITY PROTEIN: 3'-5' RNA helicase YTHDC2-like [Pecten maximus]|uniref:LOW QUALITY PROTEIN: 3'-5' RNA helicase YTHDC2-like n=1 Tax=Pecten maximus TaxID=6579 RepID=UPI001459176B|nr:LOW QUALITY PROTEIN: 3'-5' RNA helicase YTHDC2-like [Pecten maximus]